MLESCLRIKWSLPNKSNSQLFLAASASLSTCPFWRGIFITIYINHTTKQPTATATAAIRTGVGVKQGHYRSFLSKHTKKRSSFEANWRNNRLKSWCLWRLCCLTNITWTFSTAQFFCFAQRLIKLDDIGLIESQRSHQAEGKGKEKREPRYKCRNQLSWPTSLSFSFLPLSVSLSLPFFTLSLAIFLF